MKDGYKSSELLKAAIDKASDFFITGESDSGLITDINQSVIDKLGYDRLSLLSKTIFEIASLPPQISCLDCSAIFETTLLAKDGSKILVEMVLNKFSLKDNVYFSAVARDISCRNKVSKNESIMNHQVLLEAIPDLLFIFDKYGVFIDYKPGKGIELFVPPEEFLGRSVFDVLPPKLAGSLIDNIKLALQTNKAQNLEYQLEIRGDVRDFEARVVVIDDNRLLYIVRDHTERKDMEEKLKQLSWRDSLTNLYNRAYFEHEMKRLEAPCKWPVGLFICDVDGLKLVNDSLGHDAGDKLLKAAADILRVSFGNDEVIARIGGDEFCVLLPNSSTKDVEAAFDNVMKSIGEYNQNNQEIPISMSVGFSISGHEAPDLHELFRETDNKMYREKLHRSQSTHGALVSTLKKALEARDFITDGHADRLKQLVKGMAKMLNLPESRTNDLCLLAQFHDIGKVGIPDSILFKSESLTHAEMNRMKRHCEIGHRIAKSSPDLAPIATWILKHHEWWDGNGYPLGTRGEDIPLECRILAIADAYDAMTSDRPYRKALSNIEAVHRLVCGAGTQFDPNLVPIFCEGLSSCCININSNTT